MATVHIQGRCPACHQESDHPPTGELVFDDGQVQLWHGCLQGTLPARDFRPDLVVADPPYAETSLAWDRWPDGWPAIVAEHASSMWCFGSMRMFLDRRDEFAGWRLSQDIVWEKHAGSVRVTDRFRRVHEHALHWYRGPWADVRHETPRVPHNGPRVARARQKPRLEAGHHGEFGVSVWEDDGTRLQASVIYARSMHRNGNLNPTEKPQGILEPLIAYGCPPGGLVLDPFAGSCSTLVAARNLGRRAVGIEVRAEQCESAVRRLEQGVLALEGL